MPESAGLFCDVQFGKTLRGSANAVTVLADTEYQQTCDFHGVTEYMSAAFGI